ncbi:DUF4864 domain-containing protein [Falsihalocynthiibacter sp. SS001]|uniref:DUF4864 domain-containing protein n=1 Tax=Falsihalocynthiibacter sp. SS001 TaxID=3349698 RepID=UPI0036D2D8D9
MSMFVKAGALCPIFIHATQAQDNPVENVISNQIQALRSENFDLAFQFSSPAIQRRILNSSNFVRMIREAFPILMTAKQVEFVKERMRLPLAWQVVRLSGEQGESYSFAYEMILIGSEWRINGVLPLEQHGQDAQTPK